MSTATIDEVFEKMAPPALESMDSQKIEQFPEAASVGDWWRQGDLIVTLVDSVPEGSELISDSQLQIVPGSTQGARHCWDSLVGVQRYSTSLGELSLCYAEVTQNRVITHPEHKHLRLPAIGGKATYLFSRQRDLAKKPVID